MVCLLKENKKKIKPLPKDNRSILVKMTEEEKRREKELDEEMDQMIDLPYT